MDRKTLEYMEERAKRARKIVEQIEKLLGDVARVKRSNGRMDLYTTGQTIRFEFQRGERVKNCYSAEAVAAMYNAFVNITIAEIRSLEKQLAEL